MTERPRILLVEDEPTINQSVAERLRAEGFDVSQAYDGTTALTLFAGFNKRKLPFYMLAQVCGYQPGEFVHTFGDAHLYANHFEQARLQLSREPRALPTMWINPDVKDIFTIKFEDFRLDGYDPHPHIAAPVAV